MNLRRTIGFAARRARCMALVCAVALVATCAGPRWAVGREQPAAKPANARNGQESILIPTDVPIEMSAERLSVTNDGNTYTARGNVTIAQGNIRLRADTIMYDKRTNTVTARGKVIVRTGSDVVEAESITIKLADATGVVFNGKLLLTRHNVYLEGQKLEKVDESTYHIERGSFTTCDGAKPDWRITGRDLDVTLEGYGRLKHGFFYVRDIPVFYIPWFMYPAKRTRQSGFLMPTLSNSTLRGFDIRLPFFLAISPSVDATVIPRVCTKRALQTSVELRYVPLEDFKGRFYGEYTYDWQYGPPADPRSHRFYATWLHDQDVGGIARFKANGAWVSDRDYFELWAGRFDRRKRVRYLESNTVLYRQSNNALFQAEASHFDNLDIPNNAVTVQNLPIITGTLFNQQIPYTPFYFSSNVVYNHYYAPIMHKQWLGSRWQMNARLGLPVSLGNILKLEPSITYFGKAYVADYYEHDKSVKSVKSVRADLYQVDGDLFTDLHAVYGGTLFGFHGIKHTMRPRVSWTYRPPTRTEGYPTFDETDQVDGISLVKAEVRQTLTGRLGPREYLDFMTLSLSQGYDFANDDPTMSRPITKVRSGMGWTNTLAELTFKPHTLVDLMAQTEYDPLMDRARRYSVSLGLMDHRGDMVRVLHQFTEDGMRRDLNRQTNVSVQLKLLSSLDCFFENQYTHQFNFSYFTSFGLVYHPQCWSVELKYSESRSRDPVSQRIKEPDQTVFMTVSLYGLGQVYRMSREWGEILASPFGASDAIIP
ncbi:MAG: LPS assembly protein LptD [Desulfomonile sp.]|nr:LPS assembly protein LptD [Desulfomonile sp.]